MKNKIPLANALNIAKRFKEKMLDPHCKKAAVAGSVRRMKPLVGDIELVCVPNEVLGLNEVFKDYPGLKIKGDRLKRFIYPKSGIQIELYITRIDDYGRILAIRTGSSAFSHLQLAVQWNRLGWCGTADGLRRKKECDKKGSVWKLKKEFLENPTLPPPFETEEAFFEFLKIPWVPPTQRSWTSQNTKLNYAP